MPRLAVVLVALAFAAAAVVCQAADGSNYKAPQVLLQGRFEPGPRSESSTGDLPQMQSAEELQQYVAAMHLIPLWPLDGSVEEAVVKFMTWPASSATVPFTNTSSVTVVINGDLETFPAGDIVGLILEENPIFPWAFFQFDLDGKTVGVGSISDSEPLLTWTHSGISQDSHSLTITKLSEARMGAAWLESISIDPAGRFLQPPPSPGMRTGRRMLFVGDSFTVGFANIGGASCSRSNASNQNALLGYGPVTARHFEADYEILAWSGAGINVYPGLRQGSLYPREVEMAYYPLDSELIYRQDALNPTSNHNASSWVPQIIILAGGTNDFHNTTLSEDHHVDDPALPPVHEWVDMYLDYVEQVRQLYPEAAIINLVWPLEVQLVGVLTTEQTTVYLQYMGAAYSRLQMAGLSNVYMLQLTGEGIDSSNWCSLHPDVASDAAIAGQLIRFIESVLPSFASSS